MTNRDGSTANRELTGPVREVLIGPWASVAERRARFAALYRHLATSVAAAAAEPGRDR